MQQPRCSKNHANGDFAQKDRFIKTARALGADEDEATFKEKLRVIARQKPRDSASAAPSAKDDTKRTRGPK